MSEEKKINKDNLRFQPWLKTARHPQLVEYLEGNTIFPIEVEISPSRGCNAKCPKCFYGQTELGGQNFLRKAGWKVWLKNLPYWE